MIKTYSFTAMRELEEGERKPFAYEWLNRVITYTQSGQKAQDFQLEWESQFRGKFTYKGEDK